MTWPQKYTCGRKTTTVQNTSEYKFFIQIDDSTTLRLPSERPADSDTFMIRSHSRFISQAQASGRRRVRPHIRSGRKWIRPHGRITWQQKKKLLYFQVIRPCGRSHFRPLPTSHIMYWYKRFARHGAERQWQNNSLLRAAERGHSATPCSQCQLLTERAERRLTK